VSSWHRQILKHGYKFRFIHKKPVSPCHKHDSLKGCPNIPALLDCVNDLSQKGVIIETECNSKEFCNRLFLVPKASGDWRPILNVKRLNHYIIKEKFKMERIQDVLLMLEPDDFLITIDLTDAYLAVPIAKSMQRFCTFRIAEQHYRFTRVCFGLTSAPYLFTKLLKVGHLFILILFKKFKQNIYLFIYLLQPVVAYFRQKGVRLLIYMDDLLIIAETCNKAMQQAASIKSSFKQLGFIISEKSMTAPSTVAQFLGVVLNTGAMSVGLPEDKIAKINLIAQQLLSKSK